MPFRCRAQPWVGAPALTPGEVGVGGWRPRPRQGSQTLWPVRGRTGTDPRAESLVGPVPCWTPGPIGQSGAQRDMEGPDGHRRRPWGPTGVDARPALLAFGM